MQSRQIEGSLRTPWMGQYQSWLDCRHRQNGESIPTSRSTHARAWEWKRRASLFSVNRGCDLSRRESTQVFFQESNRASPSGAPWGALPLSSPRWRKKSSSPLRRAACWSVGSLISRSTSDDCTLPVDASSRGLRIRSTLWKPGCLGLSNHVSHPVRQ